jgi:tungstate transport system substrate-binding protein
MKPNRLLIGFTIVVMLLAACAPAATPAPAPTQPPAPTQAPAPTVAPTKPPAPTQAPAAAPTKAAASGCSLKLATTTSTQDSGLLDVILPDFEKKFNCKVDVIAVGTGQAIQIGTTGDADVLLVHARAQEDKFVADGHAKARYDVMYNDFIVLGPKSDPAKIAGMASAVEAFKLIAKAQAPFASRGDKSGTNTKELSVWASAGITPTKDMAWYNSLGQGMGETLLASNEKGYYTLSDRGTYLSMKDKLPNLIIVLGGNSLQENKDKTLLNPYGVMAVDPAKHPGVNSDMANNFVQWILSPETQKLIGGYGVDKFGMPLFYPNAQSQPQSSSGAVVLTITGLVEKELKLTMDAVKAVGVIKATLDHPKKGKTDYEGVKLNALLALAQIKPEAKKIVLTASDGFVAEVTLDAVNKCTDCMMAFGDGGKIHAAMPGMESNAWVKDVVKIEVQ